MESETTPEQPSTTGRGSPDFRRGWLSALAAAQKCGAHNDQNPPPEYALCVREAGHGGMHDDMWLRWGDPYATPEANRAEAAAHYRAEQTPPT